MEQQDSTRRNKEEMDLLDIIKILWQWFVLYIWKPFVYLFRFGLNKWWLLIIFGILGFVASYLYSEYHPIYQGFIIYQNNAGISSDFITEIDQLSKSSKDNISKKLGIPMKSLDELRAIAPHYIYSVDSSLTAHIIDYDNEYLNKDKKIVINNRFCVEIQMYDKNFYDGWESGFVDYFNKNKYFSDLKKKYITSVKTNIGVLEEEIAKLDSLREIEYFENSRKDISITSVGTISMSPQTKLLHRDIMSLKSELQSNKNTLIYDQDVVSVVASMQVNQLPYNFWKMTYKKFVFFGVVIGFLLLLFWEYRKKIFNFIMMK
ncbi:MAG: hypothetical protein EOL95_04670 [Bacteroidia bacterium]|nr:hypothetical protein [Bacteroidia bacterium]